MATLQLFRDALYQGKCEIVGHTVLKSKLDSLFSNEVTSIEVSCKRCNLPIRITYENGKVKLIRKY